MKRYLLAHDLGTSGNKASLLTTDGELVASVTESYGTHYFNGNRSEQDPADWWRAVRDSTRSLVRNVDPSEIAVIGFSGQMQGCLCVDRAGRPLRPAILYNDQRATAERDAILSRIDARDFYRITGHRASASYSVEKLMWVRDNEPDVYARTFRMLHAKDYLNFRLTGVMATDYSDASGTNVLDLAARRWSEKVVGATGIDGEKLPELKASTDVVGEVRPAVAAELGLRAGIPVVAGAGDGVCAGVGAGSVKPGVTYAYVGSSAWISTTTTEPLLDEQMRTFVFAHAVPGLFHPCGTMQTAGGVYAWLKNEICTSEKAEAEETGASPYELINARIASSPPGANGLVFLPYLMGERTPWWDPHARGALIGLTLAHTRADVLRAVMEGITANLGFILDIFRQWQPIPRLTVIGGGAKGDVWRKIMADVYQAEIQRPASLEEATSLGAAVIAGVGCGLFKDFDVASRLFTITDRIAPDPSLAPVYERLKSLLEEGYRSLAPVFPKLGHPA